jgi:enterobactin synthetase component D
MRSACYLTDLEQSIGTTPLASAGVSMYERLFEFDPETAAQALAAIHVIAHEWPNGVVQTRLSLSALTSLRVDMPQLDEMLMNSIHRSPRRVRSFVGGRLCAEIALGHAGLERQLCVVGRSVDGAPCWPSGWCGSISHDATEAVALAAPADLVDALGVDVEPLLNDDDLRSVTAVCLTPTERLLLPPDEESARWEVTLRFSAKEAYFKAIYPHVLRFIDFTEVEVRDIDTATGRLCVVPLQESAEIQSRQRLFSLEGRFSMTDGRLAARAAREVRDPYPVDNDRVVNRDNS